MLPSREKDNQESPGDANKICLFTACLFLGLVIQCLVECLDKEAQEQLMALMTKQLNLVQPQDRGSFLELCISKQEECSDKQFSSNEAIFSWREGVQTESKDRFWRTYQCVFHKKPNECPVDGSWTDWSPWSRCEADCEDKGWQIRSRVCENPRPAFGGEECEGVLQNNRSCIGQCRANVNGQDEANQYIKQMQSIFPSLEKTCMDRHCIYEEVEEIIGEKSKVDRYWSSLACIKYGGACPVNGNWGNWEEWSSCSVDCGNGETYRKRKCDNPATKNGGIYCQGAWYEIKRCLSKKNCDNYESFSDWSDFSLCSSSCGVYGVKTSVRSCLNHRRCITGSGRLSEIVKSVPCYGGACPQHGGWGQWLEWSPCSAKCGTGRRARLRKCDNPYPSNGEDCPGPSVYVASCDGSFCLQLPGDDDLETRRRRSMSVVTGDLPSEVSFPSLKEAAELRNSTGVSSFSRRSENGFNKSKLHETLAQEYPSGFSKKWLTSGQKNDGPRQVYTYRMYTDASSTLSREDVYFKSLDLAVNASSLLFTGRKILEDPEKTSTRQELLSKVDEDDPFNLPLNRDLESLYTEWSLWTGCSRTCGGGTRHRTRTCQKKKTVCRGEVKPVQFCNVDPCPIPGGWGPWQGWSPCSVTCDNGVSERYRACDNPLPAFGGSCPGLNYQSQPCILVRCPRVYAAMVWSAWTLWSGCSATCGGGRRSRHRFRQVSPKSGLRTKANSGLRPFAPGRRRRPPERNRMKGGRYWRRKHRLRFGRSTREQSAICSPLPCSVGGMWAAWGSWSACNAVCGLGHTYRDRTCTDPAPIYGGSPCEGKGSEVQTCYSGPCVDEDDVGVALQGNGYLVYPPKGGRAGFLMIFMRLKALQLAGTLFHLSRNCHSTKLADCSCSVLASVSGGFITVSASISPNSDLQTLISRVPIEIKKWQDVFVLVTESWMEIRLNDQPRRVKAFPIKFHKELNLDGELTVGANRLKISFFQGEIAMLRKNFKILLLIPIKSWAGYGVPKYTENVRKTQLATEVRHPDFKGRYYSHVLFRKSQTFQVTMAFELTGMNGLLFFNGGLDTATFISVIVKDGTLQYCLTCKEKPVCREAYEIKTGQWYILKVSVTRNEGLIRLNDGDAMQIMCAEGEVYQSRGFVYVGGAGKQDWGVITELTHRDAFLQGMIDVLSINSLIITYKMATLVDMEHCVNSLGYSLADHVTEVYEGSKAVITLRCGVPEKAKRAHVSSIYWFRDMKRLETGLGTEIVDVNATEHSFSKATLYSTHHTEGTYSCILSEDGNLINLHVFILMRYDAIVTDDKETIAGWICFLILLLLLLLCICPCLLYYCTKDHPFWKKVRNVIKRIYNKLTGKEIGPMEGENEDKPLLDTNGDTGGETSEATGEDSAPESTDVSRADTPVEELPPEPIVETPPPQVMEAPPPQVMETPPPQMIDKSDNSESNKVEANYSTFPQNMILLPARRHYPCEDAFIEECYPSPQCPPIDPHCISIPVYSPYHIGPQQNPCIPQNLCTPIDPYCSPTGLQQNPCPDNIVPVDLLRNPYYLKGLFCPQNINNNQPRNKNVNHVTDSDSLADQAINSPQFFPKKVEDNLKKHERINNDCADDRNANRVPRFNFPKSALPKALRKEKGKRTQGRSVSSYFHLGECNESMPTSGSTGKHASSKTVRRTQQCPKEDAKQLHKSVRRQHSSEN